MLICQTDMRRVMIVRVILFLLLATAAAAEDDIGRLEQRDSVAAEDNAGRLEQRDSSVAEENAGGLEGRDAAAAAAEEDTERLGRRNFARFDHVTFPENAPYSPQIATLGKMLFFDPRLSGAQNMSCATCHNPSFGWESPGPRAIGALNEPLKRRAPALENLAQSQNFFWDGRAASFEEQARGQITSPKEMNSSLADVVRWLSLNRRYKEWFGTLFPGEGLTENTVVRSIATFERTLESGWAPFDDWVEGKEEAISEEAKQGFDLFVGKAGCSSCHMSWALTDYSFHDIGLDTDDEGRAAVTGDPLMRFSFKTPSLRNIELRAPYMYDGRLVNLEAVLAHYQSGGLERPSKSPLIAPLDFSPEERSDLIAFLKTLTAYSVEVSMPSLPVE
jgi:cytochrome c peroxidase